jgi:HEAT repeat protein
MDDDLPDGTSKTVIGVGPGPSPQRTGEVATREDLSAAAELARTMLGSGAPEARVSRAPAARASSPAELDATLPPTLVEQGGSVAQGATLPTQAERPISGQPDPGIAATLPPTIVPRNPDGVTVPAVASALDYEAYVGRELCGYTIQRKLAEGGMGVVFEGTHGKIGRRGAIKLLKLELCRSDEVVERFYQEARAVNSIRHENIVDIYDFGRDPEGRAFFVMEYLEGEPLSARIRRGALKWSEAYPILEQTLRALRAAHDKGFVHRDLKPDNIWLKRSDTGVEVKLLDFGIAKLVGAESPKEKLTQTGSIIGTPHYMSPEQINGSKDVDHRTDIYAMGVIMYEMFAGVTPFVGDTLQAIMTGHLFKEPPRLANIPEDLGVPGPIAEIIDRMLVKDASARYDSVAAVLADLRDVHEQRQPARAETLRRQRPVQAERATPKRGKAGVLAGVALAAGLGAVAMWKLRGSDATTPAVAVQPTPAVSSPEASAPPASPAEPALDHEAVRKDAQTTLRASLSQSEPAVRVHGSDALAKIKDEPSVPALARLTEHDPDLEVRGHTADALGAIGARGTSTLLARLEGAAPPALKVWYASALARLGERGARKRLIAYARDKQLEVSFRAGLALADVSAPGDQDAIRALRQLATREAELNEVAPYAGAVILTKLAALRDPKAREILYALLESRDEGARLAAAEGLARLGDDAGKQILKDVLANEGSPNRLVGAVALIPLGEYTGYDLITSKLDAKDPDTRTLAARALGEIGERRSLRALIAMASDGNWLVRIAAASAIVAIVGLDPAVLAQASIDWTRSALGSQDWAVRKAAAGVLGDMPEKEAVPLLAQAIADPDPGVRLAASRSASRMKTPDAAVKVASAVKAEKDPAVREQQVRALGEIGQAVARDTLAEIAQEPGRVGVLAAGSLIAVGDPSGKAKLDAAVVDRKPELRLAAVESAATAKNPIVVPTLKIGILDKLVEIRFAAAEGLAGFGAEKALAVPVLEAALDSKDPSLLGRAQSALLRLGEQPRAALTPAAMLDSVDAKVRLAAVPVVRALPVSEAVPLLRRLVADPELEVRRAGVDAIEAIASKDKDQAIRLYKPLVQDTDAVVRSKAQGQLARLVEPPDPPPAQTAAVPAPAVPDPAPVDDVLPKVRAAVDAATAAAAEATRAIEAVRTLAAEIEAATATPAVDYAAVKRAEQLAKQIADAAGKLDTKLAELDTVHRAVSDAAGASPSPDAARLIAEASALASTARAAAGEARASSSAAAKKAEDYAKTEAGDPQMYVAAADAAIASGNLADARKSLDRAARLTRHGAAKVPAIDYSYAQLFDKLAARERDPAAKRKLLQDAQQRYRQFASKGSGARVQRAVERAAELADELAELGQP